MSTLTIKTTVSGLDAEDKFAAIGRIILANQGLVTKLPFATDNDIVVSYETILSEVAASAHIQNIAAAQDNTMLDAIGFGEELRKQARGKIMALYQNGKTLPEILALIASL